MALDRTDPTEESVRDVDEALRRRTATTDEKDSERPRGSATKDSSGLTPAEYVAEYNRQFANAQESPDERIGDQPDDLQKRELGRHHADTLREEPRSDHVPDKTRPPFDRSAQGQPETAKPDAVDGESRRPSAMVDSNGLNPAEYLHQYNQLFEPDTPAGNSTQEISEKDITTPTMVESEPTADPDFSRGQLDTETRSEGPLNRLVAREQVDQSPQIHVEATPHEEPREQSRPTVSQDSGIKSALPNDGPDPDPEFGGQVPTEGNREHTESESGPDAVRRADRGHEVDKVEATTHYYTNVPPTVPDRYTVRDKDHPIPLFDGPPVRDQARQGQFGDCGVVSTLGAIAGTRPDALEKAMKQTGDGEFEIRLYVVTPATRHDRVARPTGDTITYKLSDELPVRTDDAARPLAGMRATTCSWAPFMEKALASQDQVWSTQEQANWDATWKARDKPAVDAERAAKGLNPSPDVAPTGYNRLDMGTTTYQQANMLAEITGSEAEVRDLPDGPQAEQRLLDEFSAQLADNKPILVGVRGRSFPNEAAPFSPRTFAFSHAYEVTKVENGHIHVRNPWGDNRNPPPISPSTFLEYFRNYGPNGNSRSGDYATLK